MFHSFYLIEKQTHKGKLFKLLDCFIIIICNKITKYPVHAL